MFGRRANWLPFPRQRHPGMASSRKDFRDLVGSLVGSSCRFVEIRERTTHVSQHVNCGVNHLKEKVEHEHLRNNQPALAHQMQICCTSFFGSWDRKRGEHINPADDRSRLKKCQASHTGPHSIPLPAARQIGGRGGLLLYFTCWEI